MKSLLKKIWKELDRMLFNSVSILFYTTIIIVIIAGGLNELAMVEGFPIWIFYILYVAIIAWFSSLYLNARSWTKNPIWGSFFGIAPLAIIAVLFKDLLPLFACFWLVSLVISYISTLFFSSEEKNSANKSKSLIKGLIDSFILVPICMFTAVVLQIFVIDPNFWAVVISFGIFAIIAVAVNESDKINTLSLAKGSKERFAYILLLAIFLFASIYSIMVHILILLSFAGIFYFANKYLNNYKVAFLLTAVPVLLGSFVDFNNAAALSCYWFYSLIVILLCTCYKQLIKNALISILQLLKSEFIPYWQNIKKVNLTNFLVLIEGSLKARRNRKLKAKKIHPLQDY